MTTTHYCRTLFFLRVTELVVVVVVVVLHLGASGSSFAKQGGQQANRASSRRRSPNRPARCILSMHIMDKAAEKQGHGPDVGVSRKVKCDK